MLIDPPFENPGEFIDLAAGLATAHARFRTGVLAAWYPIKHRAPVRGFHAAMQQTGIRDVVAAELCLREPLLPDRLNGCGLLVVNPPFQFEQEVQFDSAGAARSDWTQRTRRLRGRDADRS